MVSKILFGGGVWGWLYVLIRINDLCTAQRQKTSFHSFSGSYCKYLTARSHGEFIKLPPYPATCATVISLPLFVPYIQYQKRCHAMLCHMDTKNTGLSSASLSHHNPLKTVLPNLLTLHMADISL